MSSKNVLIQTQDNSIDHSTGGISGLVRLLAEMEQYQNWVVFRFETNPTTGHRKKPPYNIRTGRKADPNDPETRLDYETAAEAVRSGKYDGLGFALQGTPFLAVDLDNVVEWVSGKPGLSREALHVVVEMDSYTEISPSGKGIRIIAKGQKPDGLNKVTRSDGSTFEMYDGSGTQYVTITGKVLEGHEKPPQERTAEAAKIHKKYWQKSEEPPQEPEAKPEPKPEAPVQSSPNTSGGVEWDVWQEYFRGLSDDDVLEAIFRSWDLGQRVKRLFDGNISDYHGDHSRADFALIRCLFNFTRDADLTERLFRMSALYRPEKLANNKHYLKNSIQKVQKDAERWTGFIEFTEDQKREYAKKMDAQRVGETVPVQPGGDPQQRTETGGFSAKALPPVELTAVSDIEKRPVEWLIKGWLPKGFITTMGADGGVGKTSTVCAIIAQVTTGKGNFFEGGLESRNEPGTVVYFSGEDSFECVLRERLEIAGADIDRVFTIQMKEREKFELIKFKSDYLKDIVEKYRPALLVFDPWQAFLDPKANMAARNEMRDSLTVLAGYGEAYSVTSLIVAHSNKQSGVYGRKRLADSSDLWDISRSVLMLGFTDQDNLRYISHEKCNLARESQTILYKIGEGGKVVFDSFTDKKDRDYNSGGGNSQQSAPARDEARGIIIETLEAVETGFMPVKELDESVIAAGVSKTALRRAKQEMKESKEIVMYPDGARGQKGGGVKWLVKLGRQPVNWDEA